MKLAILASGQGTTAEVLFKYAAVVVTNNPQAGIIQRAKNAGVPVEIVLRQGKESEAFGEELLTIFNKYKVDFISHNGWELLTPLNVVNKYQGKMTNSHSAPLDPGHPDFGGKGMKGLAVHVAVLNFSKRVNREFNSEICIHLVSPEFDKGDLVIYKPFDILKDDTPESLQERAKEIERNVNAEFWAGVERSGELVPIQRTERVIREEEFGILDEVKAEAITLSSQT